MPTEASLGSYQRKGASEKTAAANPPEQLRWGYASITKTVVGVVMQMLMANSSLPEISWRLGKIRQERLIEHQIPRKTPMIVLFGLVHGWKPRIGHIAKVWSQERYAQPVVAGLGTGHRLCKCLAPGRGLAHRLSCG